MSVWEAIDRGEPEWAFLECVVSNKSNLSAALGIAVALCDFQLGTGGAQKYWHEAGVSYKKHEPVDNIDKIGQMIEDLLKRPVAARLGSMKRKRIERFLGSLVIKALTEKTIVRLGTTPMELWNGLSVSMHQKPDDKTIVFAMKIFDLIHKAETGNYVRFPSNILIPVDIRIARVSLASGLIEAPIGKSLVEAMQSIDEILNKAKERILAAWAHVSEKAGGLSMFRIDSLVWQVGEPIFKHRTDPAAVKCLISEILKGYSCPGDLASIVSEALYQPGLA
jgi:N-glycosylase/DNA lyase